MSTATTRALRAALAPAPEDDAVRLLTAAEVAQLAGRSTSWAHRLIAAGITDPRGLRSVSIGRDGHGRPVRRVRVDDWNTYVNGLDGR